MNFSVLLTPVRIGDIGGVEAHTMHLANGLSALGNKVGIVCSNEPAGTSELLDKKVVLELVKSRFKIENTNITPGLPLALARQSPDVFHTMIPTPWSSDLTAWIAKLKGKKLVVTIHSDLSATSPLGSLLTKVYCETFYRLLLALADKIICVNPDYKKTFVNTRHVIGSFDKKVVSIPNGVNTSLFDPSGKKSVENNVLFVSVLDEYHEFKGLDFLFGAVKIAREKLPDIRLLVVGDGKLREKYVSLAASLGIAKNVVFLGKKSNKDLPRIYNQSAVFVLPSVGTEAFGIVLLEAMACEVPVITTEFAGMRDQILREKCGLVVPSRNSAALADAILQVLSEKATSGRMGKNARRLVVQNYSWEIVAAQTQQLYAELMKA